MGTFFIGDKASQKAKVKTFCDQAGFHFGLLTLIVKEF
jgi:hypothetical protein